MLLMPADRFLLRYSFHVITISILAITGCAHKKSGLPPSENSPISKKNPIQPRTTASDETMKSRTQPAPQGPAVYQESFPVLARCDADGFIYEATVNSDLDQGDSDQQIEPVTIRFLEESFNQSCTTLIPSDQVQALVEVQSLVYEPEFLFGLVKGSRRPYKTGDRVQALCAYEFRPAKILRLTSIGYALLQFDDEIQNANCGDKFNRYLSIKDLQPEEAKKKKSPKNP